MKLNQTPNFRVEDFPSEQSWIGRLFTQLNPFIQTLNQLFDSNIDFATNIKSVSRDYDITAFQPFNLQWPYKESPPAEMRITKATKGTELTPVVLVASWSYDATNAVIKVTSMTEVSNSGAAALNGKYSFSLRATV